MYTKLLVGEHLGVGDHGFSLLLWDMDSHISSVLEDVCFTRLMTGFKGELHQTVPCY